MSAWISKAIYQLFCYQVMLKFQFDFCQSKKIFGLLLAEAASMFQGLGAFEASKSIFDFQAVPGGTSMIELKLKPVSDILTCFPYCEYVDAVKAMILNIDGTIIRLQDFIQ